MEEQQSPRRKRTWIIIVLAVVLGAALPVGAAYLLPQRPIAGGQIDQGFLYGEYYIYPTATPGATPPATPQPTIAHHGVDFPCGGIGTPVLAAADGRVVDVQNDVPNNQHPTDKPWGNYVLIQHPRQSWDRVHGGTNSYVYTIYGHLAYHSVTPGPGSYVLAGDQIAREDNTGKATGPQLHSQVCLNPTPGLPLSQLDSESNTRNPEAWLQSYNNTGTVVGKLTDVSGNPVGDFHLIKGLVKPAPEDYYEASTTYSYGWAHPDDVLVENWGTTDVSPGTYYPGPNGLRSCYKYGLNCVPYGDEASYTVVANEVTYINLYPYSLPDVSASSGTGSDFQSHITVRNDNETRTNQANTTFFDSTSWGQGQRTDYIQSKASTSFTPPGTLWPGSGVVVGSARSAVLDVAQSGYETYAYTGVPVRSDLGLAQAKTLYIPNYANNYWNWRSEIRVQNAGRAPTSVNVTYYDTDGNPQPQCQMSLYLDPWVRSTVDPQSCSTAPTVGAIRLAAVGVGGQPAQAIAADVLQRIDSASGGPKRSAYNAFSAGSNVLYLPDLLRSFCGWTSSFWIHNIQSSPATNVRIYYNKRNGDPICSDTINKLPGNGTHEFYQGSTDPDHTCLSDYSPPDWHDRMFMATIEADTGVLVASVHQDNPVADDFQSYNAVIAGKTTLVIPGVEKSSAWDVDIIVQDASASSEAFNVYFWNSDGSSAGQLLNQSLPARGFVEPYDLIPSFTGSVVIVRNGTGKVAAVCNRLRLGMASQTDGAAAFGAVEP